MTTSSPSPAKPRTRCSWSAEERLEWITMLEQSGQTVSEFCRANDLPESTVSLWRKQLRSPATNEAGALLEVPLESLPPGRTSEVTGAVIIRLPADISLEVRLDGSTIDRGGDGYGLAGVGNVVLIRPDTQPSPGPA